MSDYEEFTCTCEPADQDGIKISMNSATDSSTSYRSLENCQSINLSNSTMIEQIVVVLLLFCSVSGFNSKLLRRQDDGDCPLPDDYPSRCRAAEDSFLNKDDPNVDDELSVICGVDCRIPLFEQGLCHGFSEADLEQYLYFYCAIKDATTNAYCHSSYRKHKDNIFDHCLGVLDDMDCSSTCSNIMSAFSSDMGCCIASYSSLDFFTFIIEIMQICEISYEATPCEA